MIQAAGGSVKTGVPSKSSIRVEKSPGGRSRRCATTTSTPRAFKARRILIGSIAVPSYSPGIGNEVAINTRIAGSS